MYRDDDKPTWLKPRTNPSTRYGVSAMRVLFDYDAVKFNRLREEWGKPEPWRVSK
jgi:hypothetical protein